MAAITIEQLQSTGLDLFTDSESFLYDLSSDDLGNVNGGATPTVTLSSAGCAAAAGAVVGALAVAGGYALSKLL
ncbi:MAG TPA: class IIb bacteriocin, lactobin A/cerein 7B family [Nostocaceae cyanobacterium]|nr:class IIb bacteriocin, lactobin A/cerein 7B family [Nostocaceae cyanobacterium]